MTATVAWEWERSHRQYRDCINYSRFEQTKICLQRILFFRIIAYTPPTVGPVAFFFPQTPVQIKTISIIPATVNNPDTTTRAMPTV